MLGAASEGAESLLFAEGPDWAAITTAVASAITAGVLVLSAVVAWRALKDAKRTRHGALLTELSRRWDEPVLVAAQKTYARYSSADLVQLVTDVYEPTDTVGQEVERSRTLWSSCRKLLGFGSLNESKEATEGELSRFTELEAIPNLWETIGVLHAERAVSLSVIDAMWGTAIRRSWVAWKPAVERLREVTAAPATYNNFEALARSLREERLAGRLRAILGTRRRGPAKALRVRVQVWYLLRRRGRHTQ
jgi:hypothetical protein